MDNVDVKIIELLQQDGRMPMKEVAAAVNMSAPAAAERVKKLEESGVIRGYTALVDGEKLGRPMHAFIAATMTNAEARKIFYAYVEECPAIVKAYYVTSGGPDAILEVYCKDMDELVAIQKDLFYKIHTLTYLVQKEPIKSLPLLPEQI